MKIRDRIRKLRRVKASELRPNPRNWRTHPQRQRDALRGVLAEVGYADALLARELPDGSLEILDGHLRAEITPDMEVPVLVVDLDDDEAAEVLATHDPLGAMAEANAEALGELMGRLQVESGAVREMLEGMAEEYDIDVFQPAAEELQDPEPQIDRAAELREKWGVEAGQLWEVGRHRVLCGDATDAENIKRLMGDERAGLCFTSPPYAQQRDYTKPIDDWDALMQGVFGNLDAAMEETGQVLVNLGLIHRDGEWVPYWDGWIQWMRERGWRRFGWYVWDQQNGLPGDWNGRLAPSHEFVFHFNRTKTKPTKTKPTKTKPTKTKLGPRPIGFRKEGGSRPASSPDKLDQPWKIPDSVIRVCRSPVDGSRFQHFATFPVGFASELIAAWPGTNYDPFLGSGTTLVACEQLGRIGVGIEIEPKYVAVTLQRLKDMGLEPRLTDG